MAVSNKHLYAILVTLIFHLLVLLLATEMSYPSNKDSFENLLVISFPEEEQNSDTQTDEKVEGKSEPISNKGVNEAAPEVEKGNYNEYNKEPSTSQKELFEQQLKEELKALEESVIQEQREEGYGYTPEEIEALLDAKENKALKNVSSQKPRSEAAYDGATNIRYKLANRYDVSLFVPVYMCQYGGVVVVNIAVNADGIVISAKIDEQSSKTSDPCLTQAALNGALKTKFNRKPNGPKIQKGSITYSFLNQ